MNFIDFLALIPLFLTILLESIKDLAIMGKAGNSQLLISEAIIVNVFWHFHENPYQMSYLVKM